MRLGTTTMSETTWAWTRINFKDDGPVEDTHTHVCVTAKYAKHDRMRIRRGDYGWKVVSENHGPSRCLIAMNEQLPGYVISFVIYCKEA